MIREGVVDISSEEEKRLDSFLKELAKHHNKRSKIHKGQSDMAISVALREYANDIVSPKFGVDVVKWVFGYFPDSRTMAAYSIPNNEIIINLAHAVGNPKLPLEGQKLDFDKIAIHVYHEWVHVKQSVKYTGATGDMMTVDKLYGKRDYYDNPWEQMAFGRGEIEWIKRNVKKTKSSEIIKWLKKWGLVQSEKIASLKKSNPTAYRKILKYAILFALKKEAEKVLFAR